MKTCCCSSHCKKYFDCQLADINNEGTNFVNNYHEWGSGIFADEVCVIEHYCGELGDYKMFEPVENKEDKEEKIPFPFQYLEKYLLGEMIWDAAIDSTLDEVYRLIEEYVEKHNLKT